MVAQVELEALDRWLTAASFADLAWDQIFLACELGY